MATAHAAELTLVLAEPDPDIYRLHQLVWHAVDKQRHTALPCTHRPRLLFRLDGPVLRVRISDAAAHRARPVRVDLHQGQGLQVRARLALWRSPSQALHASTHAIASRARTLLSECGLDIERVELGTLQIARGRKGARRGPPVHHAHQLHQVQMDDRIERLGQMRRAGLASQGGHLIELPTVEVQAWACVSSAHLARQAWIAGVGRGRRFGCGMPEYLPA